MCWFHLCHFSVVLESPWYFDVWWPIWGTICLIHPISRAQSWARFSGFNQTRLTWGAYEYLRGPTLPSFPLGVWWVFLQTHNHRQSQTLSLLRWENMVYDSWVILESLSQIPKCDILCTYLFPFPKKTLVPKVGENAIREVAYVEN